MKTKKTRTAARKEATPIRPGSAIAAEFWATGKCAACPVYDMHGHMGVWRSIYFPCAEWPDMLRVMDSAGVKLLCFAHHASLFAPELGNDPAIAAVRACPDRFRAYMSINPNYPKAIEKDLARFDGMRDVFMGLKFLAGYHGIPMSGEPFRPALEFAEARRLPVLMHTWGGDPCNDANEVRKVAARYPHATLLLGHSLNNRWHEAISVAREFPNTYLELTSVLGPRGVPELLVEGAGSDRLVFGTDLPWFEEHQGVGALLSADISDDDIHNICHRNAERILGL